MMGWFVAVWQQQRQQEAAARGKTKSFLFFVAFPGAVRERGGVVVGMFSSTVPCPNGMAEMVCVGGGGARFLSPRTND